MLGMVTMMADKICDCCLMARFRYDSDSTAHRDRHCLALNLSLHSRQCWSFRNRYLSYWGIKKKNKQKKKKKRLKIELKDKRKSVARGKKLKLTHS